MVLSRGVNMHVVGRAARDAEVKTTKAGKKLCSFTLAADKEDGENKETLWQRCTVWESSPDFEAAQNIMKGDTVEACGMLKFGSYEKQEGGETTTVKTTDLWCDILNVRRKQEVIPKKKNVESGLEEVEDEDMLPF
jgi:single-stranded DNA-binding protein